MYLSFQAGFLYVGSAALCRKYCNFIYIQRSWITRTVFWLIKKAATRTCHIPCYTTSRLLWRETFRRELFAIRFSYGGFNNDGRIVNRADTSWFVWKFRSLKETVLIYLAIHLLCKVFPAMARWISTIRCFRQSNFYANQIKKFAFLNLTFRVNNIEKLVRTHRILKLLAETYRERSSRRSCQILDFYGNSKVPRIKRYVSH